MKTSGLRLIERIRLSLLSDRQEGIDEIEVVDNAAEFRVTTAEGDTFLVMVLEDE